MSSKVPALYDVCECNHEAMLHVDRTKKCFFDVPAGRQKFRGGFPFDWEKEKCSCKKFEFSFPNTANPKPTLMKGDD